MIANVVRILGFRTAMEILEETKRIERRGGLLTVDKKRRYQSKFACYPRGDTHLMHIRGGQSEKISGNPEISV